MNNQTDKNPQKGIRKASAIVTQPYKKMEQAVFNDQKKEWSVEGVKDGNITLDQIEEKHAVCISECQDTIVQIKGKVNHILLLNCKKVGLVFDSVVSSVEVMRCQSLKVQVQFSDGERFKTSEANEILKEFSAVRHLFSFELFRC